ncbi:DUF4265 domain-containing protein [Neisseria gonorrhoeae]
MKSKLTVIYYDLESNIAEEILSGNIMPDRNFLIQEIPLFAPNLALNDIVAIEREDKMLFFDHLIKASGNTTINIVVLDHFPKDLLAAIEEHSGKIRKNGENYLSVNFPPKKYNSDLKGILNRYEEANILSYREACLGFS